ncbi:RraA family protein [Gordonia McavH-238-E]|uniref:RraA family protein n=1 Tax=Gordonia sp. McavH-238-E TaxID=2917736 RepID=UPI001EF45E5C|nr:RraA family protein [Gordonia sp. McavH-238-E]MCG7635260.1 RraA family protein [Gordonia sp. McavH-238-E]
MFITANTDNIRITTDWARASREDIGRLANHPAALIGDAQERMGVMTGTIRLATPGLRLAGTVLPVLAREGDNLAIHRALDDAQPGDVLVINANGDTSRAVFGDILGEICVAKGIAGVVIDGAVRDVDELTAMKLPVFATAITPAGPWKNGPGTIGKAVACGHVVCHPGDAIFGDSDGVVVVPRADVGAVADATDNQDRKEDAIRADVRAALGH